MIAINLMTSVADKKKTDKKMIARKLILAAIIIVLLFCTAKVLNHIFTEDLPSIKRHYAANSIPVTEPDPYIIEEIVPQQIYSIKITRATSSGAKADPTSIFAQGLKKLSQEHQVIDITAITAGHGNVNFTTALIVIVKQR
ncbi:hypothetical protein ACFL2U_02185 [Patescibacteria group bacterium]